MNTKEILYDTTAKIINRHGDGIGGRITFEASSREKLTKEILMELQAELGYHPAGYDFFHPSVGLTKDVNGFYWARWTCSTSCD